MTAGEGYAQAATLVEIDREAFETLGEEEELRIKHPDGHYILVRLHDEFTGGEKPDNRGVS